MSSPCASHRLRVAAIVQVPSRGGDVAHAPGTNPYIRLTVLTRYCGLSKYPSPAKPEEIDPMELHQNAFNITIVIEKPFINSRANITHKMPAPPCEFSPVYGSKCR